jgi:hypothetical protein
MLRKIKSQLLSSARAEAQARMYRELIHKEAVIGGKIFGAVPKGQRREFFCLDEHTWVWHEEWKDRTGTHHARTTRYDVRPSGVVKVQDGKGYQALSPTEAKHLLEAIRIYRKKVIGELYGRPV